MDSNITQCCAITGCSREVARRLLEACAGNLEMAINMHLEGGTLPEAGAEAGAATGAEAEDDVRAPIPQKTEMLVEENYQYGFRNKRRKAKSVFDGFRDFQAEAKQQEQQQKEALAAGAAGTSKPSTSVPSSSSASSSATATASGNKRKTLEDLFRPPIDLLHHGSFQSARDQGSTSNRWLLVNIQNVQEFLCQVLNRDVWSHRAVKEIVKRSFIFWQVYHDSSEGEKFTKYYPISEWPYVAIIDPRTGENMVTWKKLDALTFCDLVGEFLDENPSPDGSTSTSPPCKKRKQESTIVEASEDSQLEAAIRASLTHQTSKPDDSFPSDLSEEDEDNEEDDDDDDLETFTDSDDNNDQTVETVKISKPKSQAKTDSGPSCSNSRDSSSYSVKESDNSVSALTSAENSLSAMASAENSLLSTVASAENSMSSMTSAENSLGAVIGAGGDDGIGAKDSGSGATISNSLKAKKAASKEKTETETNGRVKEEKWKFYLGNDKDEKTKLMLRFPTGARKQLHIPCSSTLMALVQFVIEEGFSNERYELVTTFPRRKLSFMDFDLTLKDIGLHPQESVFVQER